MDYTKFTTQELEDALKTYKEQLTTMIMNPELTKIIGEVEVLEFILKSRKEHGQETPESSN
jgi:hypothetical protein